MFPAQPLSNFKPGPLAVTLPNGEPLPDGRTYFGEALEDLPADLRYLPPMAPLLASKGESVVKVFNIDGAPKKGEPVYSTTGAALT
jgi:hypothetical protein